MRGTTMQYYCRQCAQHATQKVVRSKGANPLLWCHNCYMVSILDTEIALSVDPLVFHPAIKTEVVELDHDHEIMTEYLNNLHTSFKTGQTDRALLLFDEMLHFATMHFRREEDFLNEHGYPGAVQHEADHGRVLEEMAAAKALLAAGQGTEETVLEIKFCLIEHLLEDMRYKEFLALQR